jgi:hypothetical protein
MKKEIIGSDGFVKEVYCSLNSLERIDNVFFVDNKYQDGKNIEESITYVNGSSEKIK